MILNVLIIIISIAFFLNGLWAWNFISFFIAFMGIVLYGVRKSLKTKGYD